jgi:predicted dithiol-disulfide oxidoreductase (DUF899 family)
MTTPSVGSPQAWEAARQQLLVHEKGLTRARDALAAARRRMPWMALDNQYGFDGPKGTASLLDLSEGRRHCFEPGVHGWPEHGCVGCSMMADQVAHLVHLHARDTTLADGSRPPQPDIERLNARMVGDGRGRPACRITGGVQLWWAGTSPSAGILDPMVRPHRHMTLRLVDRWVGGS